MTHAIPQTIPTGAALHLQDRPIVHRETGTYTLFPADTVRNAERLLATIGVDSVEKIDPRYTDGIPIFRLNKSRFKAKCHRQACHWAAPPTALNNPPRETYGKGMTEDQSLASAMMEAIERYSGQKFCHSAVIRADYEEVRDVAVDPSEFAFPDLPLKCEDCLEADYFCYQGLAKVSREWVWGYALSSGKAVLVPAALVYYPYVSRDNLSFMFNDTGGLAAGNTLEEAVLQGIAEVIERDALYYAFNQRNLAGMPVLDLKKGARGYIAAFLRKVPPEGIFAFRIENEKMQLGLATFSAFMCYKMGGQRYYFGGSGTSLDPEAALLRALTEMEQQKIRQKIYYPFDPNDLVLHPGNGALPFSSAERVAPGPNIKEHIDFYLDRLASKGMDVIAVDLTHPVIGIPVVRVIIPGMIAYSGSPIKESVLLDSMRTCHG